MKKPFCIWLTGWSGAGKSTVANILVKSIPDSIVIDGDVLRRSAPQLGYDKASRMAQVDKTSGLAYDTMKRGRIPIVALISPYRHCRKQARNLLKDFVEVYIKCDKNTLISRDTKGLYKQALEGKITNLTGINDPYEEPINPEVTVDTTVEGSITSSLRIINYLIRNGYLL